MNTIAIIALLLLSLVGFSAGAVVKTRKSVGLKPHIMDLFLVGVILSGALYSRSTVEVNKWILIVVWLGIAFGLGIISKFLWKRKTAEISIDKKFEKIPGSHVKRLWLKWNLFALRMGGFQSRIFLAIFFFLVVSPFAFMVKIFSDPLRIKDRNSGTRWVERIESKVNLESIRRQF